MKIINDWPPNIDAIRAVLPVTERNIFTYGSTIYNPSGAMLGPELIAHEQVHEAQQGDDPVTWWDRYLADAHFRLEQELAAHRAEYTAHCRRCRDRNQRSRFLTTLAQRLAAPMYGGLMTVGQARSAIR